MTTIALIAIAAGVALLQSTWIARLTILGARPDLVLLVLSVTAYYRGTQRGQISGFVVGMVEDAVSLAPLGFNAVLRLWHAAVVGLTRSSVMPGPILTPILLTTGAFVVRLIGSVIVGWIVGIDGVAAQVFSLVTLIEAFLTVALAPVAFLIARPFAGRLMVNRA